MGASFENKEIQYCIHQDSGRLLAARPGPKQPKLWPKQTQTQGMAPTLYICIHKYVNICIQVYVLFCYISIYVYIDKTVFLILFHFDWPKNWNLCTDVRCFLSFSLHIHAESFGHHRIKHLFLDPKRENCSGMLKIGPVQTSPRRQIMIVVSS